jgi:hypothetical protein
MLRMDGRDPRQIQQLVHTVTATKPVALAERWTLTLRPRRLAWVPLYSGMTLRGGADTAHARID